MKNVIFRKTGFTDHMNFTVVKDSKTNNGLLSNNQFRFQDGYDYCSVFSTHEWPTKQIPISLPG
jgi:hypothetical protein